MLKLPIKKEKDHLANTMIVFFEEKHKFYKMFLFVSFDFGRDFPSLLSVRGVFSLYPITE